ncbi:MAG: SNF2-related protein [Pirellulales bacterium]
MNLAKRCRRAFSNRDWQRGEAYFARGDVWIVEQALEQLALQVQGSELQPYDVLLDWGEVASGRLFVDCSCPRYADAGVCKHLAAAILEAERAGFGAWLQGNRNLRLIPLDDTAIVGLGADELEADVEDYVAIAQQIAEVSKQTGLDVEDVRSLAAQLPMGDDAPLARGRQPGRARRPSGQGAADWRRHFEALRRAQTTALTTQSTAGERRARPAQFWYVLMLQATREQGLPRIVLHQRKIKKNGEPGKLTLAKVSRFEIDSIPNREDRRLLGMLAGNANSPTHGYSYGYAYDGISDLTLRPAWFEAVLPALCASGRFGWLTHDGVQRDDDVHALAWDDGPPWEFRIEVSKSADRSIWRFEGTLRREDESISLDTPLLLLAHGLVIFADRIARLSCDGSFSWIALLRANGPLSVPVKDEGQLVEQLATLPAPVTTLPPELSWQEQHVAPVPLLKIIKPKNRWNWELECQLTFRYGDQVATQDGPLAWFDRAARSVVRRDPEAEAAAGDRLQRAGASRGSRYNSQAEYFLAPSALPKLVLELSSAGWEVEAEGQTYRRPGSFQINVTSGVDWFDLTADCDFGDVKASLPQLLAALESGQQFVQLDDGSQGLLPHDWLKRFAPLAALGQAKDQALRFVPTQASLLDALLAAQEADRVQVDRRFAALRQRLRSFDGIQPRDEPKSFVGELRPYQRAGLGWLHFLDDFGFGGCLADDMGLGKTVQILALLDGRCRQRRSGKKREVTAGGGPSLVVVPRSLVFNWIEEARRFTPELRVLNYTGLERRAARDCLSEHDVVITTYGTLRRDVAELRNFDFDYAILDEAQAIKNSNSQAAKACRLLKSRRRLAITGTPVENHLGELWSLFEFLNPGMLGRHAKLNDLFAGGRSNRPATEASGGQREDVALLARALRPFMLRRTKEQVLTELPPKTEQTLYCELDRAQRAKYDELRGHYRRTLLARVDKVGVNKSKIHVLEALLRLRQAACHPGLLDKSQARKSSAKLETLLEQLAEVLAEGHKALVFSQFTSLLAIVRDRLDQQRIVYEYLDGRTVKRQDKVERFQSDESCRLFLISLKAGGQGLNLTAADYVFILDPWWNPAVEAQAVDRAHRIGQDRHVFAYRLIARDTVEEKILELQDHKRGLAEAIISADNSLLRNLTAEDLQLLLS